MTTSSIFRTYQCKSILWQWRSNIGYTTICPGPCHVTSPPLSTVWILWRQSFELGSNLKFFFGSEPRPSVNIDSCCSTINAFLKELTNCSWRISDWSFFCPAQAESKDTRLFVHLNNQQSCNLHSDAINRDDVKYSKDLDWQYQQDRSIDPVFSFADLTWIARNNDGQSFKLLNHCFVQRI